MKATWCRRDSSRRCQVHLIGFYLSSSPFFFILYYLYSFSYWNPPKSLSCQSVECWANVRSGHTPTFCILIQKIFSFSSFLLVLAACVNNWRRQQTALLQSSGHRLSWPKGAHHLIPSLPLHTHTHTKMTSRQSWWLLTVRLMTSGRRVVRWLYYRWASRRESTFQTHLSSSSSAAREIYMPKIIL